MFTTLPSVASLATRFFREFDTMELLANTHKRNELIAARQNSTQRAKQHNIYLHSRILIFHDGNEVLLIQQVHHLE